MNTKAATQLQSGTRRGTPPRGRAAPANRRDDGLLSATLDALGVVGPLPQRLTVHLDAGYDWQPIGRS